MRKIIPLEYQGKDSLDFNLYDSNGVNVYNSGEKLTPGMLLKLNSIDVYRYQANKNILCSKDGVNSKISFDVAESLLDNNLSIMDGVNQGYVPSVNTTRKMKDSILNEVSNNFDKIKCIDELRLFDEYTYSHTINVSSVSVAIGMAVGMKDKDLEDLALGALLHDLGKMKIPKEVLNKPSRLTNEEFELIKQHTILGYDIVLNEMKLPKNIAEVAKYHQEKYQGAGYPEKLKGDEIPIFAQITAIADVYDALVSERVYKKAMTSEEAFKLMLGEGEYSFNPFYLYEFVYLSNYITKKKEP